MILTRSAVLSVVLLGSSGSAHAQDWQYLECRTVRFNDAGESQTRPRTEYYRYADLVMQRWMPHRRAWLENHCQGDYRCDFEPGRIRRTPLPTVCDGELGFFIQDEFDLQNGVMLRFSFDCQSDGTPPMKREGYRLGECQSGSNPAFRDEN